MIPFLPTELLSSFIKWHIKFLTIHIIRVLCLELSHVVFNFWRSLFFNTAIMKSFLQISLNRFENFLWFTRSYVFSILHGRIQIVLDIVQIFCAVVKTRISINNIPSCLLKKKCNSNRVLKTFWIKLIIWFCLWWRNTNKIVSISFKTKLNCWTDFKVKFWSKNVIGQQYRANVYWFQYLICNTKWRNKL